MCSFNISLQHHKEDKHLGSKNTSFSDYVREEKIRWVEITLQMEPHSYYGVLLARDPLCSQKRLTCCWNIDIHMEMLPFINIIT